MKNLQSNQEERWRFTSFAQLEGVARRTASPKRVILLLHGLGERGKRIFRKLLPFLPDDALVIAPNAPFPIPRLRPGALGYGHSWYFYDKSEQKYFINQDLAKFWLRDLLKIENPSGLPVTIIGFSQGGYLAPLAGLEIKETELVIGIACEFRTTLIKHKLPFGAMAIHGKQDEVIRIGPAQAEIHELKNLGVEVEFQTVDAGHEITQEMGLIIQKKLETHGD